MLACMGKLFDGVRAARTMKASHVDDGEGTLPDLKPIHISFNIGNGNGVFAYCGECKVIISYYRLSRSHD